MTVDLDAIAHNTQHIVQRVAPADVMAVVKADGYNHGAAAVARTVLANGATDLGVATIPEAVELRRQHITAPILAWIWDPSDTATLKEALAAGIDLGVPSIEHLAAITAALDAHPDQFHPHLTLALDSGLSRSGFTPAQWPQALDAIAAAARRTDLTFTGAFTHLACADEPTHPNNDRQKARFEQQIADLADRGVVLRRNHMANSPATLTRPDMYYQMVRPGVILYGMEPLAGITHDLRPAMTVSARVTTTRIVAAGESVSYSATWTAPEDTRTAIVAIGYADGLPRALSGRMRVEINGRTYPQIGRVCMDQIVVNLGPARDADGNPTEPTVSAGDESIIFGPPSSISAGELADNAGTIHYEILTSPHPMRLSRRYTGRGIAQTGRIQTRSADHTRAWGAYLGAMLRPGDLIILDGPVGAGKTTLTQGIAAGMGVKGRVTSPTFTIARVHPGQTPLVHLDAYRLLGEHTGADVDDPMGVLDSLDLDTDLMDSVVVAEWAADMAGALRQDYLLIRLERAQGAAPLHGADPLHGVDPAQEPFEEFLDEPRTISWEWVRA